MSRRRRPTLKPKSKVWLELAGRPVFGDGKARMLETIERAGSLTAAAGELGMSYRGLWGRLREMERRLGMTLVSRRTGGAGGGGAELTDDGAPSNGSFALWLSGNAVTSRMFGVPVISMSTRSSPGAIPPCGGAPYRNARRIPPNSRSTCSRVYPAI